MRSPWIIVSQADERTLMNGSQPAKDSMQVLAIAGGVQRLVEGSASQRQRHERSGPESPCRGRAPAIGRSLPGPDDSRMFSQAAVRGLDSSAKWKWFKLVQGEIHGTV